MIVHWMLEEIGAPYSIEVKDYGTTMKAPEYLAINPMGKVPAIRHGDTVVTEAAAICAYLADAFPEAGLAPPPAERGAYYRWLFFAAGCVEPAMSNHAVGWDPATEMQAPLRLWLLRRRDGRAGEGRGGTALYRRRRLHRGRRLCRLDDRLRAAVRRDREAAGIRGLLERPGKSPRAAARRRRGGEAGVEASLGAGVIQAAAR